MQRVNLLIQVASDNIMMLPVRIQCLIEPSLIPLVDACMLVLVCSLKCVYEMDFCVYFYFICCLCGPIHTPFLSSSYKLVRVVILFLNVAFSCLTVMISHPADTSC